MLAYAAKWVVSTRSRGCALAGHRTAREHLDHLLDAGSFSEVGMFARSEHEADRASTPADGKICGHGTIDSRPVTVAIDDVTVKRATSSLVGARKSARVYEQARRAGNPFVYIGETGERGCPTLVVGGDPRGRGVVATANYVARRFGIHSAMSAAEALRRCPQAVFVRPRHSLYREYSRSVWETVRGIVPTVEQTGMDEGYLDLGEVAADFLARAARRGGADGGRAATSLTCSLGVAPCKVVAKVASDARKPGGLVVVPPGGSGVPRAARRAPAARGRAEGGAAAPRRGHRDDRRSRGALRRRPAPRCSPGSVGTMLRDRARGIDPRGLEHGAERISISVENTFERDISDRERLHDELRGMAAEVAEALQRRGQVARTVTTKLRYADFSIRSRSISLDAGIDDAETIGDLACRQLDRGLNDRPGALRLVGVGVSGLADFRQLSLEAV